jgi:calcium/calmodulin-dependent protein kinase I
MRNGIQKTNSSGPPGYLDGKTHPEPLRPASALVDQLDRSPCTTPLNETASKEPDSGSLDDLLASAASTPSNRHLMMPPTGVQRAYSTGMVHPMMVEDSTLQPSMQSVSALSRLQRAQTCGDGAYQQQQFHYNIHHLHQSENNYPNLQMPQIPPLIPQHPLTGQYHTVSSSDHSQNVGLMLDDSENSHSETNCFQEQPGKVQNGNYSGDAPKGGLEQMLADPNFVIPSAGYSPSSPANIFQPTPDIKKAFTNFHNASKFARDATSAFLGGESSSNIDLAGTHESYVSYHAALMRAGRRSSVGSGDVVSDRALPHRLPPLETVDEQNISIHKGMRLLKPVQGTESWQQGRRYLIGPAALATCSLSVINRLSGTLTMSATEAATSDLTQGFGTIDLGGALMTYIGEKHHLSLGKWSSCRLVLKQNYLYEFDVDTPINGLPRGFVHLQYAVAYPHADFHDSLELQFFASPCAKADHRTLMIQVQNREERDHWVTCLNKAAKLRLEDLWEFDSSRVLGVGRYASVVPAKRKAVLSHGTAGCALKIVDKNQFWRRVVKGRERADTLVRELAVQSTLTIKCGRVPTFVQLRGFFETSDNVVIELELLEGKDLFDYVKSKGVLGEEEAGVIIRDVLTSLDCMNRIGLAHRDVKPANILMTDIFKDGTSVKLGDFGMSTFVGVDGLVRGRCGTPGYVAPEILTAGTRAGYGNSVDVFSAGVSLYVMLAGYEPFYGETEKDLVEANKLAEIAYAESDWSRISPLARDLVERMLQKDPSQRITAKEALQHPWLATFAQKKSHGRIWKDTHGLKNLGLAVDETPEGGVCTLM